MKKIYIFAVLLMVIVTLNKNLVGQTTTNITNVKVTFEISAPNYPPSTTWTVEIYVINIDNDPPVLGTTLYSITQGVSTNNNTDFFNVPVPNPESLYPYQVIVRAMLTNGTQWHYGYSDFASERSLENNGATPVPLKITPFD